MPRWSGAQVPKGPGLRDLPLRAKVTLSRLPRLHPLLWRVRHLPALLPEDRHAPLATLRAPGCTMCGPPELWERHSHQVRGLAAHRLGSRPCDRGGTPPLAALPAQTRGSRRTDQVVLTASSPGPSPFVDWVRVPHGVVELPEVTTACILSLFILRVCHQESTSSF